jgi:Fibronectin type III domain
MKKLFLALVLLLYAVSAHSAEFTDMVFAGYQGWFGTSCDSEFPFWSHWRAGAAPAPGNVTFELYPDVRDYAAGDLCATGLANLGNGSPDMLFASGRDGVIDKHFRWMQTYGIDGVALQRYLVATTQGGVAVNPNRAWNDSNLQRVKTKAELYGRSFYIQYDISGVSGATLVSDIQADFTHVEGLSGNPLGSANYAKQGVKPVIGLWGCGYNDASHACTTTQAQSIISWFKGKGYYVVGGIPHWWNDGGVFDPAQPSWQSTYFQFDMIAPWSVGSYSTDGEVDSYFSGKVATDKALATANGVGYAATVFAGFAWSNWNGGSQNMIPRRAGNLFWRQAYRVKENGTNAYIAMFDEYDEGTAIAKAAENSSMIPTNQYFLTLDADGTTMSSDFYLRLAGDATKMIKGTAPHTLTIPTPFIAPTPPTTIARTGSCAAAATSCTLSAVTTGDLVLVFAYRTGSTTAPSAAAGNTSVRTVSTNNGGTTGSYRLSCRRAASSSDTSTGVYTNASAVVAVSYSGTEVNATANCATTGIGTRAATGNGVNWAKTSATVNHPTFTLLKSDTSSWVVGFMGGSATASVCSPGGLTNVVSSGRIRVSDTNASVNTWAGGTCSVSAQTWMSETVEILFPPPPVVGDSTPPTNPSNLLVSVPSASQLNLSWTASTDAVGVTGYRVERCTGSGCVNFSEIATPTTNSLNDGGLAASTLYRYRVRATDAANNLSGYSNIAETTTFGVSTLIIAHNFTSTGWVTFGQVLPQGFASSGNGLILGGLSTQVDVKNTWPDGSTRFAVVTANVTSTGVKNLVAGTAASGTFSPTTPNVAVQLTIGGTTYTATQPAIGADLWLSGPNVKEWRSIVVPTTSGAVAHPFLQVIFDTRVYSNGQGRVDITVENLLNKIGATTVTYDANINVNGSSVFSRTGVTQYWGTRWRKVFALGGLSEAAFQYDWEPVFRARALPRYLSMVSNISYDSSSFDIMQRGPWTNPMNDVGDRAELAPIPDWVARWLVHKTASQRAYTMAGGDLGGSWPVHVRKTDQTIVSLDEEPLFWFDGRCTDGWTCPLGSIASADASPLDGADSSHMPSIAYVPYLATGDRYYMEEMNFWANHNLIFMWPAIRGSPASLGLFWGQQPRGWGWGMRILAQAAAYTPDNDPRKAYFTSKLNNNLAFADAYAVGNMAGSGYSLNFSPLSPIGFVAFPYNDGSGNVMYANWESQFIAYAIDFAWQQGFTQGITLRDKIVQMQIDLFNSNPPVPPSCGAPYRTKIGTVSGTAPTYYTTMQQVFDTGTLCGSAIAANYGVYARVSVMIGIREGFPNAQSTYDYLNPILYGTVPPPDCTGWSDLTCRAGWSLDFATADDGVPVGGGAPSSLIISRRRMR